MWNSIHSGRSTGWLANIASKVPDRPVMSAGVDTPNVGVCSKTERQRVIHVVVPACMCCHPFRFGNHVAVEKDQDVMFGCGGTGIAGNGRGQTRGLLGEPLSPRASSQEPTAVEKTRRLQ